MWTCVTIVYLVPAAILSTRLLSPRAVRSDGEAVLKVATHVPCCGARSGSRARPALELSSVLFDYWALTKPEINFLIAITTAAGFWIGTAAAPLQFPVDAIPSIALGDSPGRERSGNAESADRVTVRRANAANRSAAARFGQNCSLARVVRSALCCPFLVSRYLAISTNALASLLAALTLLSYLFVYTPLKRITPLCTLVGAIPGAAPPLIGWAAARGRLDPARLDALCDRLSLAIPSFHGHRVDVSRRLRTRRLSWCCLEAKTEIVSCCGKRWRPRPFSLWLVCFRHLVVCRGFAYFVRGSRTRCDPSPL